MLFSMIIILYTCFLCLVCSFNFWPWQSQWQNDKTFASQQSMGQWLTLHTPATYDALLMLNNQQPVTPEQILSLKEYYFTLTHFAPTLADSYFILGFIEYHLNNIPEALTLWEKTALLNPQHFLAFYNMATIYSKLQNIPTARALIQHALSIPPTQMMLNIQSSKVYQDIFAKHQSSSQLPLAFESSRAFLDQQQPLGPIILF